MQPFLKTNRLLLRNLSCEDLDILYDYRNNADCARYQHWTDTSREALRDFINTFGSCTFPSSEPEQHFPAMDIVGLVEKENLPSVALLKKLGFVEEAYSDKIH